VKRSTWTCLAIISVLVTSGTVVYLYVGSITEVNLVRVAWVIVPVFMLQPFCALWMLYQVIRREAKPLPYVILALFVPFAFIWYYLERVRTGTATRQLGIVDALPSLPSGGQPKVSDAKGGALRRFMWICLAILSVSFAVSMVFFYPFSHPLNEELGRASYVVEPILIVQPFCAFWMLYQVIRREAKPLPYAVLALFVPFAFIWYYLERVQNRK
jgi:hypothetical protein